MKKGQVYTGQVEEVKFPNKGVVRVDDTEGETCVVKNVIKGQRIEFQVSKKKGGKCEGRLLNVLQKAENEIDPVCRYFGVCGGCTYQNLPYDEQLELKKKQVGELIKPVYERMISQVEGEHADFDDIYMGVKASPIQYEYRNKMEFSFGNEVKDGPITLGMHKKGSMHDIVTVTDWNKVC